MRNILTFFNSATGRNFLIYSLGALFLKGVSFLLIPLYTRVLTPVEFGNLDLLSTFSGILDVVLSLGLAQVVFIEFFHLGREGKIDLINRVISIYISISTFLYILMFVIASINYSSLFPGVNLLMIMLSMSATYLTFFQSILLTVLRLQGKALQVTILQICLGCIGIILNVYLVYYLGIGIIGILISGFFSVLISFLYGWKLLYQKTSGFKFRFNKPEVLQYLLLGLPFIPNALSSWAMNSANRWILFNYTDMAEVGLFAVAVRFSSMFDPLIIQPFLSAYSPPLLKKFKDGNFDQPLLKISIITFIIFVLVGLFLQFIGKMVIGEQFYGALPIIPVLAIGLSFSFIAQASSMILLFHKKVGLMLAAIIIGSLSSILFNFVLIKYFGGIGAAYGTVAGNAIWAISIIIFASNTRRKFSKS
jgi:O-antigen/teichoic acid export membrane protein